MSRADHEVGREEAANAVGIARALAAFHLDKLAASGLFDVVSLEPEHGRCCAVLRRRPSRAVAEGV